MHLLEEFEGRDGFTFHSLAIRPYGPLMDQKIKKIKNYLNTIHGCSLVFPISPLKFPCEKVQLQ